LFPGKEYQVKIVHAAVRLFLTIMFLGLATSTGVAFFWFLFVANLLLFVAWAVMALHEEEKEVTNVK
jgi:flagellar biosynthesis component FlhA